MKKKRPYKRRQRRPIVNRDTGGIPSVVLPKDIIKDLVGEPGNIIWYPTPLPRKTTWITEIRERIVEAIEMLGDMFL